MVTARGSVKGVDLSRIAQIKPWRTRRHSTYDRSGGNADNVRIEPGATFVWLDERGAGVVTHLWCTFSSGDLLMRRHLIVRMFWDGQDHPSVECPIGDFFGQGWGLKYEWHCLLQAAAPAAGNSLVSYIPMPYGLGARIEIVNLSEHAVDAFYGYADVEERPVSEDDGRLHAQYRQSLTEPAFAKEEDWELFGPYKKLPSGEGHHVLMEAEGAGHFFGCHYYVNNPTPLWYGEGDDLFQVDGEAWPGSHHGTGTEDYFNQAWCPDTVFLHPYFGTARAPGRGNDEPRFGWLGRTHCYRFHVLDPIRFTTSLRASIEHGHANGLCLDLATVAFWYQTTPSRPLSPLPPVAELTPRPPISVVDVHRWRDAWRISRGGGTLYGTERAD